MFKSHCSDEALLAHLDGELGHVAAQRVRRHLNACWECRRRLAELEEEIHLVTRACREQPFPQERIARAKLRFAAWERRSGISFRRRPRVPTGFAAAVAVGAIALVVVLWRLIAPAPDARGLLIRARQAEGGPAGAESVVAHQSFRVELRADQPAPQARTWQVEVYSEPAGRRFAARWRDSAGVLRYALWRQVEGTEYWYEQGKLQRAARRGAAPLLNQLGAIDLDAESLERAVVEWVCSHRWRPVSLAADLLEFTAGDGVWLAARRSPDGRLVHLEVRQRIRDRSVEATLVLEAKTYRPRLEIIRLKQPGRFAEIRLIADRLEFLPARDQHASLFVPDLPLEKRAHVVSRARPRWPKEELAPPMPDQSELAAVEVEALQALHEEDACLGDPIELRRGPDGLVHVDGLAATEERKRALLARLEPLQLAGRLRADIRAVPEVLKEIGEQSPASRLKSEQSATRVTGRGILVQDLLASYFRKQDREKDEVARRITDFSNRAVSIAEAMLAEAWALRNLSERFPRERAMRLPPESRRLVERMAADHLTNLRGQLERARALWQGPLAGIAPAVERPPASVPHWDDLKSTLFADVEQLHSLVHGLVAGAEPPAGPIEQSATRLLALLARADHAADSLEQTTAAGFLGGASLTAVKR